MKKFNKITVIIVIVAAMTFSTCEDGSDDGFSSPYPLRYEAHPAWVKEGENTIGVKISKEAGETIRAASGTDTKYLRLNYADSNPAAGENGENEYVVYLGYIKNVPMLLLNETHAPVNYNGTTPVTISWGISTTEENTIRNSVTKCYEETVYNGIIERDKTKIAAGFTYGGFSVNADVEIEKVKENSTTKKTTTETTVEAINSRKQTVTSEGAYHVGGNGEPAGLYRVSLFATTDVFYYIKLNADNTELIAADLAIVPRNDYFSYLDYSPDGNFNKNSKSDPLPVPDLSDFSSVPFMAKSLYSRQNMDGPTDIQDKVVIVKNTNSYVSTYTSLNSSVSPDKKSQTDYIFTDFNIADLRTRGYKNFKIQVNYQRTIPLKVGTVVAVSVQTGQSSTTRITQYNNKDVDNYGKQILTINSVGNGTDGRYWGGTNWTYDAKNPNNYASNEYITYTLVMPLNEYNNQFWLVWSAEKSAVTGSMGGHIWNLGKRYVTVFALKDTDE